MTRRNRPSYFRPCWMIPHIAMMKRYKAPATTRMLRHTHRYDSFHSSPGVVAPIDEGNGQGLLLQAVMALTDLLDSLVLLASGSEPDVKVGSLHAELLGQISNLHPSLTGGFKG